ncbi:MAG TPA: diguanylate cyclase [Chloroflexia bacterium]|nr:diguanylate cyclase [Chloroflexia bacterium]
MFQFSIYQLPLILSAIILFLLSGFVLSQRRSAPSSFLLAVIICLEIWITGFIFEIAVDNLTAKIILANFQFLGIDTLPVAWLGLTLTYTGHLRSVKGIFLALLATAFINQLVIWTDPLHHLFRDNPALDLQSASLHILVNNYSYWYYCVQMPFVYLTFAVSAVLLFFSLRYTYGAYRKQILFLLFSTLLPLFLNALYVLNLSPVPHFNLSAVGFTVSGLLLCWSIGRYRFLDLLPVARDVLVDNLEDAWLVLDCASRLVDLNQTASSIIGIPKSKLVGKSIELIFIHQPQLLALLQSGKDSISQVHFETNNTERYYDLSIRSINNGNREKSYRLAVLRDITRQVQGTKSKVIPVSGSNVAVDDLTGALTRSALATRLQEEFQQAGDNEGSFALLMVDLDHFKSINDAFGHTRGDQVLSEFVLRVQSVLRPTDSVFRYGGDEFVILLPDTNCIEASGLAAHLLEKVQKSPFPGEPPVSLTVSIGMSAYPHDAETAEDLFETADRRAYTAKRTGRSKIVTRDNLPAYSQQFKEPGRLLERDTIINGIQTWLRTLSEQRRRLVLVAGPEGSGHTAMLAEIRKNAHLYGYASLDLDCTLPMKFRQYGAFQKALAALPGFESSARNENELCKALSDWLQDRGYAGLVINIDNAENLDTSTKAFLNVLLESAEFPPLAVVCASRAAATHTAWIIDSSLREMVNLAPLSLNGVRFWLRHSLRWEPQEDFLQWFYGQTGGLPALVRTGLETLVERAVLLREEDSWELSEYWLDFNLANYLNLQRSPTPNNLPVALSELSGKDNHLKRLSENFNRQRLLSMVSMNFSDTTRLALQFALENLENFQGVYHVPLAGVVPTENGLVSAILNALGLSCSSEKSQKFLFNYLYNKKLLLLLEQFDAHQNLSSLLMTMLEIAPGLKILVTSESALNLSNVAEFKLSSEPVMLNHQPGLTLIQLKKAEQEDLQSFEETPAILSSVCVKCLAARQHINHEFLPLIHPS